MQGGAGTALPMVTHRAVQAFRKKSATGSPRSPYVVSNSSYSAQSQCRRTGDVGDWSAYPSIAADLVQCRERLEVPVGLRSLARHQDPT
jgi:hypothetical protein